uniref:Heme-binding protein 2 n=1 Tax=Leptobrachium leishanense TaxID=445787 RepID=A0A8C5MFY4_9ANUR
MAAGVVVVLSLLCLCSAVVTAEEEASDGYKAPRFCRKSECPKYLLVKKYENFELRAYEGSRWVTTELEVDSLGLGIYRSFRRLSDYINGKNSEDLTIKMTVPVRIYIPFISPPAKNATMSLFVPPSVAIPPLPLRGDVYIESFPPTSVYVKSFRGFALNSDYEKKAKVLSEELTKQDLRFDNTFGTAAAYNDPLTFFDRHNEVWYSAL